MFKKRVVIHVASDEFKEISIPAHTENCRKGCDAESNICSLEQL